MPKETWPVIFDNWTCAIGRVIVAAAKLESEIQNWLDTKPVPSSHTPETPRRKDVPLAVLERDWIGRLEQDGVLTAKEQALAGELRSILTDRNAAVNGILTVQWALPDLLSAGDDPAFEARVYHNGREIKSVDELDKLSHRIRDLADRFASGSLADRWQGDR